MWCRTGTGTVPDRAGCSDPAGTDGRDTGPMRVDGTYKSAQGWSACWLQLAHRRAHLLGSLRRRAHASRRRRWPPSFARPPPGLPPLARRAYVYRLRPPPLGRSWRQGADPHAQHADWYLLLRPALHLRRAMRPALKPPFGLRAPPPMGLRPPWREVSSCMLLRLARLPSSRLSAPI